MAYCCPEFIDAYNEMLNRLGCRARVGPPNGPWHAGSLSLLADDGLELGVVPNTIEPVEMVAVVRLLEKSFARGVAAGRARIA